MHNYRRIIALIDIQHNSEHVARRALQLARTHGALLGFAAIIDYKPGFECDHAPFMTPRQMLDAIRHDVTGKVTQLVGKVGAQGSEILIVQGSRLKAIETLTNEWQAELLLVDVAQRDLAGKRLNCDVLSIQNTQRIGLMQGIANAISMAF